MLIKKYEGSIALHFSFQLRQKDIAVGRGQNQLQEQNIGPRKVSGLDKTLIYD